MSTGTPYSTPEELLSALYSTSSTLPGPFQELNESFLLSSAYLVFFMHCGFAMLSIGCVRAKFAKHIAILILVDATASALGFYLFGFAFAYGDDASADGLNPAGNAFIGKNFFAMDNMAPTAYYNWVFQWTFAATACTIVSGAIAERTRFEAYILYSLFMSSWVYPVLIHSIWSSSGWASAFRKGTDINELVGGGYLLFGSGAIDFAGSGAVHMVGGYAAFAGAWVLGPRIGRFLPDGTSVDMAGHNTSLFVLGVMILWFGWYGFNPGSQLAIVTPAGSTYSIASAVSNAAVTTSLAPAAAGLTGLFVTAILLKLKTGKHHWDIMAMGNSTLAGLVAITAGCSTVYPWAAIAIGIVSGFIYPLASRLMVLIRIDDPLDAIAVHAFNGTWGVWAVGLFGAKNLINTSYGYNPYTTGDRHYGCFMGGGGNLLAAQVVYSIWLGAECDHKKAQAQADSRPMPLESSQGASLGVAPQLPPGLKLPPMPKGWKPGMPIPGLDELLSAGGVGLQTAALPAAMPAASTQQQASVPAVQSATGQLPVAQVHENPAQDIQQAAQPAVRPAPFVPDFVLNPTLEAVEEEYSSSDYSDEEI